MKRMIGVLLLSVFASVASANMIAISSGTLGGPSAAQLKNGWSVTNYGGVEGLNFKVTLNDTNTVFQVPPSINLTRIGDSTYTRENSGTFNYTFTFDFSSLDKSKVTLDSLAWDLTQAITWSAAVQESFLFTTVGGGTFDLTASDVNAVIANDGTATVGLTATNTVANSGVTGLTSGNVTSFAVRYQLFENTAGNASQTVVNYYGMNLNYSPVVPEPTTVGLFMISSISLLCVRRLMH